MPDLNSKFLFGHAQPFCWLFVFCEYFMKNEWNGLSLWISLCSFVCLFWNAALGLIPPSPKYAVSKDPSLKQPRLILSPYPQYPTFIRLISIISTWSALIYSNHLLKDGIYKSISTSCYVFTIFNTVYMNVQNRHGINNWIVYLFILVYMPWLKIMLFTCYCHEI